MVEDTGLNVDSRRFMLNDMVLECEICLFKNSISASYDDDLYGVKAAEPLGAFAFLRDSTFESYYEGVSIFA